MLGLKVVRGLDASNKILAQVVPTVNYAAGGDGLNLDSLSDPNALGAVVPNVQPASVSVYEESIGGYYAETVRGTNPTNWKLQFFTAGGAEVAAGAYPVGITGGTVVLEIALAVTNG